MSRAARGTIALGLLAAVLGAGCGDDDAPPRPSPGRDRGLTRPGQHETSTAGSPPPAAPSEEELPEGRILPTRVEPQPIRIVERVEGAPEGAMPRAPDPAAEIRTAIGDPSACLGEADRALGRDVAFDVEVDVQASGAPGRVEVRSPGLSEAARDCVASRARATRYSPVPRLTTVQTSVVLRRTVPVPAGP